MDLEGKRSEKVNKIKGESVNFAGITKFYGQHQAVKNVSLSISAGEFVSILGPSGSGKTTLLTILAGFETATNGQVTVGVRDVTRLPANKRGIGMVFQRYALFPHMTVAQNIMFPLKMRGIKGAAAEAKVARALSLVQLDSYRGRKPHELSGGQQQRVAVARALVFEPPVLLMDEPLGALDKKLREELQHEIKSLHRQVGVTIIYVTHDQEEALTMSDRIAVMRAGAIEQLGAPKELYYSPENRFVADFLGKMNFIGGRLSRRAGAGPLVQIGEETIEVTPSSALGYDKDQDILLAVRPESLVVSADSANSLRASIEAITFVGSYTEYRVRLRSGQSVDVQIAGASRYEEGMEIQLKLLPQGIRVFPGDSAL